MRPSFLNPVRKFLLVVMLVLALLGNPYTTQKSYAFCCKCCQCWSSTVFADLSGWVMDWLLINLYFHIRLYLHRIYFWDWQFWSLYLTPLMSMMAEQLAAVGMQQMQIIGEFLDAKEQMETQRDLQRMQARIHKDYHPSMEMCEFGSRIKSLAQSERQGEMTALAMSQRSIDRMLGHKSSPGPYGRVQDIESRLKQYRNKYCDRADNNGALLTLCLGPLATASKEQIEKYNKDVDYSRTYMRPMTLDVNYTNVAPTEDEEDIMALGANLYGFFTFQGVDPVILRNTPSKSANPAQQAYLDLRAYVAKQNVAENSFNALVSLKSEGTTGSKQFLQAYLKQLGISSSEYDSFLGKNPSYYAQMEILTKLAYQNQSFYTALYDKPANVERKGVAIQAISLMQKFDLLKSYLRTEATLSVLLEMSVEELQNEVEDAIDKLDISAANRI